MKNSIKQEEKFLIKLLLKNFINNFFFNLRWIDHFFWIYDFIMFFADIKPDFKASSLKVVLFLRADFANFAALSYPILGAKEVTNIKEFSK